MTWCGSSASPSTGGGDAHVRLDLPRPVGRGLHHRGLVDVIPLETVPLEGALPSFPLSPRAVAASLLLPLRLGVGQDLLIVGSEDLLHVGARSIGDF